MNTHTHAVVAHIDILGYSDLLKLDEQQRSDAMERLERALRISMKEGIVEPMTRNVGVKLNVQQFSDNVLLSCTYDPANNNPNEFIWAFVRIVNFSLVYQKKMMEHDFYVRGAIASGQHYISDDNIILSEALIKAYNLETQFAMYPRIIVDQTTIQSLQPHFNRNSLELVGWMQYDWTGEIFLNPFDYESYFFGGKDSFVKYSLLRSLLTKEYLELLSLSENEFHEELALRKTKFLEIVSKNVQKHIDEFKDNPHIRRKYIWLFEQMNDVQQEWPVFMPMDDFEIENYIPNPPFTKKPFSPQKKR